MNESNKRDIPNDFSSSVSNYWHNRTYDFCEGDTQQEFYDEALPEFFRLNIIKNLNLFKFSKYTYPTYLKTERPWELAWPKLVQENSTGSKFRRF